MGNRVSNSLGQAAGHLSPIVEGISKKICGAQCNPYADRAECLLLALAQRGIALLALDFDMTMINCHTGGDWLGTPAELCRHMRPLFTALVQAVAAGDCGVRLMVVTFSSQTDMIRAVLVELVGAHKAAQFVVIGADGTWDPAAAVADAAQAITLNGAPLEWLTNVHRCKGKIPWLCAAWAAMDWQVGPGQTVLVDDDCTNVELAARVGIPAVHFDCEGLSAEPRALSALEHLGVTRRLLFLDVNGVLNSGSDRDELAYGLLENLQWLVKHCAAEVVITTGWKQNDTKLQQLKHSLKAYQLPIFQLPVSNVTCEDQGILEIKACLNSLENLGAPADSPWLLIDHQTDLFEAEQIKAEVDNVMPFLDESHFVQTVDGEGLVPSKAIEAAEKLLMNSAMQVDNFVEAGRLASIAAKRLEMAQNNNSG